MTGGMVMTNKDGLTAPILWPDASPVFAGQIPHAAKVTILDKGDHFQVAEPPKPDAQQDT